MFHILIPLGVAQGLFLSLLLIRKRVDRSASFLLAALMIVLSIMLAGVSLQTNPDFSAILPSYPHLYGIIDPLPFLIGPLLYLYARLLLKKDDYPKWNDIFHLVPFLLCVLYFSPFYSLSAQDKLIYVRDGRPISSLPDLIAGLRVIHGLVYVYFSNQIFQGYLRNKKTTHGSVEMIKIKWIGLFTKALFFLWSVLAVLLLFKRIGLRAFPNIDVGISLLISLGLYAIGYAGLRKSIFFTDPLEKRSGTEKYKNSGLTTELSGIYIDRLISVMKDKKFFKDNDLTLKMVADKISISPNHLSQIINEHLNLSFNDFINEYRVKEAQQLILSATGSNLKLLAIAYEVGFNSKSTFNAAFRKIAGMSPSEFRKETPVIMKPPSA
jgi:AraC-like DNA-binding protein